MSLSSHIVDVTPEMARSWLSNQHEHQRPVRATKVEDYAIVMRNGQWKCTSQGITFDTRGKLMDGGHRLHAVIESGCTIQMRVTNGEDPKNFPAYDDGVPRSPSDRTLLIEGDRGKNKTLVTLVRAYVTSAILKNSVYTSPQELREHYVRHKRGFDMILESNIPALLRKNSSVMAAVAIYASVYPGKASQFLSRVSGTVAMREHDPAQKLLLYIGQRTYRGNGSDYWYTISACRVDYNGGQCMKLYQAADDMVGNQLKRLKRERKLKAEKSHDTRKMNEAV